MFRQFIKNPNIKIIGNIFYRKQIAEFEEIVRLAEIGKFSCSIFHDLLNPITSMSLYFELMIDKKLNRNEMRKALEPLKETNEDIRNFIRVIQKNINEPNKENVFNENEVIKKSLKLFVPKSIKNNVSIVLVEKDQIEIKGNELKFYQIVINLISNALDAFYKVNDSRKKRLSISVAKNEKLDCIELNFHDNGIGIPKKNQKKIFNFLFSTKEKGIGIGLSSTKNIIENDFHGKITIRSTEGQETNFRVVMPLER